MELSSLVEEYLKAKELGIKFAGAPVSPRTVQTYREQLRSLQNYAGKTLEEMNTEDAENAVQATLDAELSDSTRNLMLTAGRGFFDWALKNEKPIIAKINPFTGIRMSRRSQEQHPKSITETQFRSIVRAMEQIDAENVANAVSSGSVILNTPWINDDSRLPKKVLPVKLMFYGGLRISEAASLKIDNIMNDGVVVDGKGKKQRFVPLPAWLISELMSYVRDFSEDNTYVFTPMKTARYKEGTHLSPNRIHEPFHEAVRRAGLPEWVRPHTLRHSFAKRAINYTNRVDIVQDLLGHTNSNTTRIYLNNEQEDIRRIAGNMWN